MSALSYNERAWAVDVISEINRYAKDRPLEVRRAGGEHTLKIQGETSLFPDVLLFGDDTATRVRHGWEMKFPDTRIDDAETVANAEQKARRLGVNSFLIWNVDSAALHILGGDEVFHVVKTYGPINVTKRSHVKGSEEEWKKLLFQILEDLNRFFASGQLVSAPASFLGDVFFADFLEQFTGVTAQALKAAANANGKIEAEFELWFASNSEGWDEQNKYEVLAQAVIVGWINRLLFCHYLKGFRKEAAAVDEIEDNVDLQNGFAVLAGISERCDFMQVFQPEAGAAHIPNETWVGLKQLNAFMRDLASTPIPQSALRLALEGALAAAKRKIRGQFTTPDELAALVISLGMVDRVGDFLDPCCGTGTIPKAALLARKAKGQDFSTALSSIWASDRFQFPLQFTTMALAEPLAMGTPLRVFRADVFTLMPGKKISIADPNDGSPINLELPKFSTIASNLPFVRFESLARHDPDLPKRFTTSVAGGLPDARSDLFAYIVLFLQQLLTEGGRICVIVSNAWLGTEWGEAFRARLHEAFDIEAVVTSGKGRWFHNADVVTNVLLLRLRKTKEPRSATRFITTLKPVKDWDSVFTGDLATQVHGHSKSVESTNGFRIRSYAPSALDSIEREIIGWPGLFADISWIEEIKGDLVRAQTILEIARGERRGWDPMFFPRAGHSIEPEYIKPVVISARGITGLLANADGEAFCCSATIDQLKAKGDTGALNWIKLFKAAVNKRGEPLPSVLARSGHHWYEMKDETTADFAIGMNPEDRIFAMRLKARSFVNQRLIRLSARDTSADLDLVHALLNSSLSIFFIESSGFGRGLGALDIQPTKLKAGLKLLNPADVSGSDRNAIIKAFRPLLGRDVKQIDQEMTSGDRVVLDDTILGVFGKSHLASRIRASVLELYSIRKSVKN